MQLYTGSFNKKKLPNHFDLGGFICDPAGVLTTRVYLTNIQIFSKLSPSYRNDLVTCFWHQLTVIWLPISALFL